MELLVNPTSYSNALKLIDLNVHQIFIGDNQFCVRNNCNLSLKEIKLITENKKNTKIIILINKFFFDYELIDLENYLIALSKMSVDGIMFSDMAVNQICYEQKISIPLIYNHETLVTNSEQFPFYLKNDITEVSLARELKHQEIEQIVQSKKEMKTQIQVSGYGYIMHSRWKLISNFCKIEKIRENLLSTPLLIREISRKHPMIIYEDENGTHVFTKYVLNLLTQLPDLQKIGLDTIRIDTFLHNEDWTIKITKIYLDALKHIDDKNYINNLACTLPVDDYSHGFYFMNQADLIYLKHDDTPLTYE